MNEEPQVDISSEQVDAQTDILGQVADDLHRDQTERDRANKLSRIAIAVALVLSVIDLVAVVILVISLSTLQDVSNQSNERTAVLQEQSQDIRELLTVIDPTSVSGREAAARNAVTTAVIVAEIDCRTRLAVADLPPPAEGEACVIEEDQP